MNGECLASIFYLSVEDSIFSINCNLNSGVVVTLVLMNHKVSARPSTAKTIWLEVDP